MFTFLVWFGLIGICLIVAPVVIANAISLIPLLFRLVKWIITAAIVVLVMAVAWDMSPIFFAVIVAWLIFGTVMSLREWRLRHPG